MYQQPRLIWHQTIHLMQLQLLHFSCIVLMCRHNARTMRNDWHGFFKIGPCLPPVSGRLPRSVERVT